MPLTGRTRLLTKRRDTLEIIKYCIKLEKTNAKFDVGTQRRFRRLCRIFETGQVVADVGLKIVWSK